ncbi:SDR family NAD(P)-dependent oxidoreductase [Novosphingobium colocasiae]|nr:SDR family NAD(P)-dependent oxidoreductase [Novosphingobium colocasiae]
MTMRFDGKVAIVTGAGRGLGREQALLLARCGASVVVNDLGVAINGAFPSSDPAQEVVDLIRSEGGKAIANFSDVSTNEGVRNLVADAVKAFGGVDILVGNAGITMHGTAPENLVPEVFDKYLDLMVSGLGLLVAAAWPYLKASRAGRIVLTSSSGGIFGLQANPYYCAAKGGVIGLLRSLTLDGEAFGIKVNALCPLGSTRLFAGFTTDEEFNRWFDDRARPEYVAPMVGYLSHADCEPTGRAFLVGLGHVSEIFFGLTQGWNSRGHTIEDIRDHFAEIADRTGYVVPTSSMTATGSIIKDAPVRKG